MQKINLTLLQLAFFLLLSNVSAQNSIVDPYLQSIAEEENLSSEDIQSYTVTNAHTSQRSALSHYYLRQQIEGIEVFETQSSVHIKDDGKLFRYNLAFIANAAQKLDRTEAGMTHLAAIQEVSSQLGYDESVLPVDLSSENTADQKKLFSGGSISEEQIPIKLMYYLNEDDKLNLCYDLSIYESNHQNWWSLKVDANTGEIVSQINWVVECNFDHLAPSEHTCTHDSNCQTVLKKSNALMSDTYNVYAVPVESPNHGSRSLELDPADLTASPFGWHDTNGVTGAESTETRGNNVNAQDDQNGNNGTGYAPNGTTTLNFDFPINFNNSPASNRDASLTNLFYWNNVVHDVFYQYGFDEAAGNFQENNYGNGGLASDRVNADGLDGSGTNNANFATPPDGGNPRMQMFLWSAGSVSNTTINTPSQIAGAITGITGSFGPSTFNLTEDIVLANDGTTNPTEACSALTNGTAMTGKIALIDRGNCEFSAKAVNAQNAGAVGMIICQNSAEAPFSMGGGVAGGSVTIPSIMISRQNCDSIKAYLPNVNITMSASSTGQQIDGSFDNGIIVHEYGHGISIRLTGGANNSNCLNNDEQMGEGWSDWFGMVMTIKAGDVGTTGRGVGTYAITQSTTGSGIRAFPYSTDMTVDPRTYDDINTATIPHGVGSIWSAMLWEMTWSLIDTYGFDPNLYTGTGGNNIAIALVTEALKLQPCSPGFIDGRDAIIDADLALYGGQNACLIWEAFAKRGLGFSATQGSTNSRSDGVEAFDVPTTCQVLDITKTADADTIIAGDTITYTLTFDNQTVNTYNNLIISDTILEFMTYVDGSATGNATHSNGVLELSLPTVASNSSATFDFQVVVDADITTIAEDFVDGAESAQDNFFLTSGIGSGALWKIDNSNPNGGTFSWFAEITGTTNQPILTTKTPKKLTANSELRFWHLYNTFLNEDGGRVEMSIDNKSTWIDLDTYFTQNGYDGFVIGDPAFPGFTGTGNTNYIETVADLSSFSGEYAHFRFIMFATGTPQGDGWRIDDITVTNTEKSVSNIGYFTASPGIDQEVAIFPPIDIIAATCTDGIQNGGETGIDLGGSCTNSGPCDFDLILTGDPAVGNTTYQAQNQITSSANVGPNTNYFANCILLENDFEVEIGNEFLAEISPCTAFTNSNELELKVINTLVKDKTYYYTLDVNIPEDGAYIISLSKEEEIATFTSQFLAKGVHRIKFDTTQNLSNQEIQIFKK